MSSIYTHALLPDGWHVVGPEVDYLVIDGAHIIGSKVHAATIASMLAVAYAAGRWDLAREMAQSSADSLTELRRR